MRDTAALGLSFSRHRSTSRSDFTSALFVQRRYDPDCLQALYRHPEVERGDGGVTERGAEQGHASCMQITQVNRL